MGNIRRPLITKRKQQNSSQINREGQKFNKPKLIPPMNKKSAPRQSTSLQDMPSRNVKHKKIDLLGRPRSNNASKDVPKVRYQSIILEEPIESKNNEKSKVTSQSKKVKSKKDNSDKDAKLQDNSSVNYGYHPIIDFFPRYRFHASRK